MNLTDRPDILLYGGDERIRTADLCRAKAALSQLSHVPVGTRATATVARADSSVRTMSAFVKPESPGSGSVYRSGVSTSTISAMHTAPNCSSSGKEVSPGLKIRPSK